MRPLELAVDAVFASSGALSRVDERYVERDVQRRMALGVAQAISLREALVVEAGTGVGKTYAYLVPTLLSGARTLISTATKNLQEQLFLRDLPRLREALQAPVTVALLKGRGSYLCTHRLNFARHDAPLDQRAVRTLARVERWARITHTGDIAEIEGLDERSSVIPLVTSSRENCLGSECPEFRGCHVMKARRQAMLADLVVVNHHLFFADMALRDTGVAELLPSVDLVVFDEAHQLPEVGVQFLGTMLGSAQGSDFARDMLAAGLQHARGLQPWQALASACRQAASDLHIASANAGDTSSDATPRALRATLRLRWEERSELNDFVAALNAVHAACSDAQRALEAVGESAPDFPKLAGRAAELATKAELFARAGAKDHVRWIDVGAHQVRLLESPLDIREVMRAQMGVAPKAWVFTSATLGDNERLSWFTEPAGLDDTATLRLGSPFDYAAQARLYVPADFPKPSEPGHPTAVANLAARCARILLGRTFVLTTTLRALKTIGTGLRESFAAQGDAITVLVQGSAPKRQLLQQFLDEPAAVLVGSHSFWEGVDVPGAALQCVLIDKLPFPPPNDPLVEARVKRLEAEGRNAFADYFVAEAAVALKQGAGRLIRSETDRGMLVVCDPRLTSMSYGKRLRAALPPMTQVASEDDALAWLASLRK